MYSRAARVVAFARPASNSIINTVPCRPFTISQIRHQTTEQHNQPATATDAIDRVSDRIKHDHRELEQYYNNIKSANRDDDKVCVTRSSPPEYTVPGTDKLTTRNR
jgi:hypothetical protein